MGVEDERISLRPWWAVLEGRVTRGVTRPGDRAVAGLMIDAVSLHRVMALRSVVIIHSGGSLRRPAIVKKGQRVAVAPAFRRV